MGPCAPLLLGLLLLPAAPRAQAPGSSPVPSPAPSPLPPLPPATVEAVERAVTGEMERLGIPGMTVALAAEGEVRFARGYGLADVENAVAASPATVYRLASISKPITATAVMQLAERGRLDLDAAIHVYVPSWPRRRWPVSSRQLLSHLGGIRNYSGGELESVRRYRDLEEGLGVFRHDPPVHQPGSRYLYTTYGYTLLGRAVELVSGRRFGDYLRENVFAPAGMVATRPDDAAGIVPNRARGYRRDAAGELENSPPSDTSYKVPGGGLAGTAEDVARFAVALQGGVLLRPESVSAMLTPQRTTAGRVVGYGLGWELGERDGLREAWHTGTQQQVSTILLTVPERRRVVVLLANLEGLAAPLAALARQLSDLLP